MATDTQDLFNDLYGKTMSEDECGQQTQDDMNAIAHMLEASEKEGLQCEVVYQLIQIMCNTTNIPRACAAALSEWDI